jgi:hypothetical protein
MLWLAAYNTSRFGIAKFHHLLSAEPEKTSWAALPSLLARLAALGTA